MKKLVLLDKIYRPNYEEHKNFYDASYLRYLHEFFRGFSETNILINKRRQYDKRLELNITGPEEVFVYNLLKKEIGEIKKFNNIKLAEGYKGNLVDVGKHGFGLFVDCGIFEPEEDVLITLHNLREQLCHGKKRSVREFINAFGFCEHYPLKVKITEIDASKKQIQGKIDDEFILLYKKIMNEQIDS
jgi:hypothetical protein